MTATMLMSEPLFEVDLPPEQRTARAQQFSLVLEQMMSAKFILDTVPTATDDASLPWSDNIYFESLDACALVGMLHLKRPKRYLEIGSEILRSLPGLRLTARISGSVFWSLASEK